MSVDNTNSDMMSKYARIFHLIFQNDKISKQDIAVELNLSLPTVTNNLKKLEKAGWITADDKFTSTVGRKAVAYSTNDLGTISLGLSIYKHHITITALNLKSIEIAYGFLKINYSNNSDYYHSVCDFINNFIEKNIPATSNILGIGIGIQGLVSSDQQTVLYGKIYNNTGLTTDQFSKYLDIPVNFYHDADCVAVAEQFAQVDHRDSTYLSIGEHVGTAIIINDSIYSGDNGRSGTMEHITLNPVDGRQCYCGNLGCIETYCSLSSLLSADETIDGFIKKLHRGDSNIQTRWDNYLKYLAMAINDLHMFLDNQLVIAGDLAKYITDSTLQELDDRIKKITAFPEDKSYLKLGKILHRSVAKGAALPALSQLINDFI